MSHLLFDIQTMISKIIDDFKLFKRILKTVGKLRPNNY